MQVAFLSLVKQKFPYRFNLFLYHNGNFLIMCEYNFLTMFQSSSIIFSSKCLKIKVSVLTLYLYTNSLFDVLKMKSSNWRCSTRKGVLNDFAKNAEKYQCQSLFFDDVTSLELARGAFLRIHLFLRTYADDCFWKIFTIEMKRK